MMGHPIYTVPNRNFPDIPTKYTATLLNDGKVEVCVETMKQLDDGCGEFADVTVILPNRIIKEAHNLTNRELEMFTTFIYSHSRYIMEYMTTRENKRAKEMP